MAFPSTARDGQTHDEFGKKYMYSELSGTWAPAVPLASLSEIRISQQVSQTATASYETAAELPLVGNTAGQMAFVQETNRLYLWSGTGWYNVATITSAAASVSSAASAYTLATDGTPTVLTLTQSGLESPTWSYAVTSGSLGRTATVSQAANVFTITPSTSPRHTGSFGLTFKATDGSNTIVKTSQFTMSNTAPVIGIDPNPSYSLNSDGTPSVVTLAATDAEGHPITWSYEVVSGSLEDTTVTNVGEVFTLTPGSVPAIFSIKFIASDSALFDESTTASFILEFIAADQYYNRTTILLTTPGAETGTNYDIVDNGPNNIVTTVYPAIDDYPTVNADSPYSPTNFSLNGGYSVAANASLLLGTQSFTLETWVYSPYIQSNSSFGSGYVTYGSIRILVKEGTVNKTGKIEVYHGNNTFIIESANVLSTQTWHHIAVTRDAATNIMTLYVDGVSVASLELPSYIRNFNANYISASQMGQLQMCDLRMVRGSVVYTSNFDRPTSALTPISGTVLLTLSQNNSAKFFKDLSPYKNAVSPSPADSSMTPLAPFASKVKYDPTIHGGSCMFSKKNPGPFVQSNNSITGPGTGDYTLEFWFRRNEDLGTNYSGLIQLRSSNSHNVAFYLFQGNYPSVSLSTSNTIVRTIQLPTISGTYFRHVWYHVAIVRSSGTTNVYIDGELSGTSTIAYNLQGAVTTRLGRTIDEISNWSFGGQLSDVRFVNGTAVYTAPFEVPTSKLTAIPGTEYLFNFDNPKVITEQTTPIGGRVAISDQVTKYSPTSMYFDGTDGLYLASGRGAVATNFETGDFTMECWVYPTNNLTSTQMLFYGQSATVQAGMRIASGSLQLFNGSVKASASLSGVSINQWIHCAIVRYNNTVKVYVNGVSGASVSDTNRYSRSAGEVGKISIGTWFQSAADQDFSFRDQGHGFVGYMEDLRVTEGVARYTSNFTPPTAPLGWSNAE
jgi:hypothetical protein